MKFLGQFLLFLEFLPAFLGQKWSMPDEVQLIRLVRSDQWLIEVFKKLRCSIDPPGGRLPPPGGPGMGYSCSISRPSPLVAKTMPNKVKEHSYNVLLVCGVCLLKPKSGIRNISAEALRRIRKPSCSPFFVAWSPNPKLTLPNFVAPNAQNIKNTEVLETVPLLFGHKGFTPYIYVHASTQRAKLYYTFFWDKFGMNINYFGMHPKT